MKGKNSVFLVGGLLFLCFLIWEAGGTSSPEPIIFLEDDKFYHVLCQEIDRAKEEIEVVMFLFKTTPNPFNRANGILKKLKTAAMRGVRVKLVLERDGYPESSVNQSNMDTARRFSSGGAKVEIKFDSPRTVTHAKIIVIDKRLTFLGSHNFTQGALKYNREASVLIDSREFAKEALRYISSIE